jgi:phosphatidylserine decarboxylase
VFAPGVGRLLGATAAVLLLLAGLVVTGAIPHPIAAYGALLVGAALWAFFAVFFRDPDRVPGDGIVSAADGRIRAVEREGERWRISVFMSVANVHVNRWPLDVHIESIRQDGAGFRPAYRPDSEGNVRRHYALATALGPVEVVQITGILARRLVTFVHPGAQGRKGERFGMIVLGSRVDVLLPADRTSPTVAVGDRVRAGETTIARVAP